METIKNILAAIGLLTVACTGTFLVVAYINARRGEWLSKITVDGLLGLTCPKKSNKVRVASLTICFACILMIAFTLKVSGQKDIPVSTKSAGDNIKGTSLPDTVSMKHLVVPYDCLKDRDGIVTKVFYRRIEIKDKYIVILPNGNRIVNGTEMYPDYFKF